MATVVAAHAEALTPLGKVCGAAVADNAGVAIGTIVELMIECGAGRIAYAALASGGVLGVGEQLFAVPWSSFVIDPLSGALSVTFSQAELQICGGFDKDAWPTGADAALTR